MIRRRSFWEGVATGCLVFAASGLFWSFVWSRPLPVGLLILACLSTIFAWVVPSLRDLGEQRRRVERILADEEARRRARG